MKKKRVITGIILIVWAACWIFFLAREDKDGQYASLKYFYTHDYADKQRRLLGDDLYEFLVFCMGKLPQYESYKLLGFEKFSIKEVRARYFLWPLRSVPEGAKYVIVYGRSPSRLAGYSEYIRFRDTGRVLIRLEGEG